MTNKYSTIFGLYARKRCVLHAELSTIWVDVEKKLGLWTSFRGRNPESKQVRGQNKQCIWNPDFRQAFNPKPTVTYFWDIWLRNSVPDTWNTIDTERKKKQKKTTHSSQFKESFISRGESEPVMKSKADWLRLGYLNYMLPERILSSVFGIVLIIHCLVTNYAQNLPAHDGKHLLPHSTSVDRESGEHFSSVVLVQGPSWDCFNVLARATVIWVVGGL